MTVANRNSASKGIFRFSAKFRSRRDIQLKELINRAISNRKSDGPFRILDLGGRFDYWIRFGLDFIDQNNIEIVCVNYSVEEMSANVSDSHRLSAVVGDARNMADYSDGSFDMVHSNSVIEHVGLFHDMRAFSNETRRLAPCYYAQTPYFWFPIDPHFPRFPMFHWLPLSWRHRLVRRFRLGWSGPARDIDHAMRVVESSILLDRSQFRTLFPDAKHRFEWFILPKSMIAERG